MRETLQDPSQLQAINIDKSLELVGELELAKEMLTLFNEKLPKDIAAITSAYETSDYEALRDAAHKLVGGSAYCGIDALRTATRALEYAAEDRDVSAIHACYKTLQDQLARFHQAYADLLVA